MSNQPCPRHLRGGLNQKLTSLIEGPSLEALSDRHAALQLPLAAVSADDEGVALALHEEAEQLDLAVHVAALQGRDHAVRDLLRRPVPVVLLSEIIQMNDK